MMFTERETTYFEAAALLKKCGLEPVEKADYRVGIYDEEDDLAATGALVGDMLQMPCIALDANKFQMRETCHAVREFRRFLKRDACAAHLGIDIDENAERTPRFRRGSLRQSHALLRIDHHRKRRRLRV